MAWWKFTSYDERAIDYGVCHHVVPWHFYIVDKLLHQRLCVKLRLRCVKLQTQRGIYMVPSKFKPLKASQRENVRAYASLSENHCAGNMEEVSHAWMVYNLECSKDLNTSAPHCLLALAGFKILLSEASEANNFTLKVLKQYPSNNNLALRLSESGIRYLKLFTNIEPGRNACTDSRGMQLAWLVRQAGCTAATN